MYSRNRNASAEERYAKNIPPVYGGSRFYRGAGGEGIAVQYEAKPRQETAPEEIACEALLPTEPEESDRTEAACDLIDRTREEMPCGKKETAGGFLKSIIGGEQEELLLIALLLLLAGEGEHASDMIVILLLLLIVR